MTREEKEKKMFFLHKKWCTFGISAIDVIFYLIYSFDSVSKQQFLKF